jgi:ribosomal protein S18 acetylase RimI-like enzyme
MSAVVYRPAVGTDAPFLRRMLAYAAEWRETGEVAIDVDSDPQLAAYVEDWMRPGDDGVVAEVDGVPAGAAWCRLYTPDRRAYGFIAPEIPELGIAIEPVQRGRGIGTALLAELASRARDRGVPALSLSVELANPARRLYERAGYVPWETRDDAMTMRLDL